MSLLSCPTDVVHASLERVWALLTDAESIARWSGTRWLGGPRGAVAAKDQLVLGAELGLTVRLDFLDLIPRREITVDAALPFGIINHEVIVITPTPAKDGSCRVTFN